MKKNVSNRTALAALLFFVGIVLGISGHLEMFAALIVSSLVAYFADDGTISSARRRIKWRRGDVLSMKIREKHVPTSETFLNGLLKYGLFRKVYDSVRESVHNAVRETGVTANPTKTARSTTIALFVSFPISIIIAIAGIILSFPVIIAFSPVLPLAVYASPRIAIKFHVMERSSIFDEELAYFYSYLQIVHTGGTMIYSSILSLVGKKIFPGVEADGLMLKKWVEYDDSVQLDAINEIAENHSHHGFQAFLRQYYGIAKSSVSNLPSFISESAQSEFQKIIEKDEKLIGKAGGVFIMGAMMMIMAPILMVLMSFVGTDSSTTHLITMGLTAMPIMYAGMVLVTFKMRQDGTLYAKKIVFAIAPVAFVMCYVITRDALSSVAIALAIPCIINGRYVAEQIRYIRSLNDHFPVFIRDLIESRKVDANFIVSIKKLSSQKNLDGKYGAFSNVLRQIRMRLEYNTNRSRLIYDDTVRSWRLRMLMFVFQTIFDAGGGSIDTLEKMHSFSVSVNSIKNKLSDSIMMSSLMLYVAPTMFFVALVGVSVFMGSFSASVPELPPDLRGSLLAAGMFAKPDFSSMLEAMRPAFLIMSICSGIVISRVAYMSFFATMPIGICCMAAFVVLTGWHFFFDLMSDLIGSII